MSTYLRELYNKKFDDVIIADVSEFVYLLLKISLLLTKVEKCGFSIVMPNLNFPHIFSIK